MEHRTAGAEHVSQKLPIFMEVKPHPCNESRWSAIPEIGNLERSIGTCHQQVEYVKRAGEHSYLSCLQSICDIACSERSATQKFVWNKGRELTHR